MTFRSQHDHKISVTESQSQLCCVVKIEIVETENNLT